MKAEDIKIGMKVTLKREPKLYILQRRLLEDNSFLYVIAIGNPGWVVLSDRQWAHYGEVFHCEDMEPFMESNFKFGQMIFGLNKIGQWIKGVFIGKYEVGKFCFTLKDSKNKIVDCSEVKSVIGDNGFGTTFTVEDLGKTIYCLHKSSRIGFFIEERISENTLFEQTEEKTPSFFSKKELLQWLAIHHNN